MGSFADILTINKGIQIKVNVMSIDLDVIKEFIDGRLGYTRDYTEFVLGEVRNSHYTNIVTELIILQKKVQQATERFLTLDKTLQFQRKLLNMIIYWNPAISHQLRDLHDYYVDLHKIVRTTQKMLTLKDHNPYELIYENRDKYMRANDACVSILTKFKDTLIDDVDLYAFFYFIIASVESMEYPIYENLRTDLIKYNLHTKFDVDSILSVTTKKKAKNSKTGYQTDSRMIRNALGHFEYIIKDNNDSFNITFNNPVDPNESITMNDVQFGKFVQNHRLLLQSVICIHSIMMAFSNLNEYFCKDI